MGDLVRARELMGQVLTMLRLQYPKDTKFCNQIFDKNIFYHLFNMRDLEQARELMNQAVTTLRQKYPKDNEFFAELIKQGVFVQLCEIGAVDKAFQLFETMPADFVPDSVRKHNKNLKKIALELMENKKSVSEESKYKILQILGMLIEDPDKEKLMKKLQHFKLGGGSSSESSSSSDSD